ncbi:MAG: hypothetical protein ACLQBL_14390 [Polyangiaceae bacterium]
MNRIWGHTLSAASLLLAVGSAAPACAHDDGSLFVHGVLYPPIPSGGICTYNFDPTALMLTNGTVDGALTDNYTPEFLLGNQLIAQGNSSTPDVETSRIEVQGAIVQVVDPATNATVENNTVLSASIVDPASGSQPSYSGIATTIMDAQAIKHFTPASAAEPSKIAVVYVTFYGETLGGQTVQSNQFQFPVNVCFGCLYTVPTGAVKGYCAGAVPATETLLACQLGQDQIVDCQACNTDPLAIQNDVCQGP